MGGKSSKQTDQSTKVVTTTTTNIRDVGVTGKDAASIVSRVADSLDRVTLQSGTNYTQLVGGAGKLVDTIAAMSKDILDTSRVVSGELIRSGESAFGNIALEAQAIREGAAESRRSADATLQRIQLGGQTPEDTQRLVLIVAGTMVALGVAIISIKGRQ